MADIFLSYARSGSATSYGTQRLTRGFEPDPVAVAVQAGGTVNIAPLSLGSGCVGWATSQPDVIVNLTGSGTMLRFCATSSADTALAVFDPDGNWRCNDDTQESNPEVAIAPSLPGTYRVWVTAPDADDRVY